MAGVPLPCGKIFPAMAGCPCAVKSPGVLHLCVICWLCSRVTPEGGHCQVAQGLLHSYRELFSKIGIIFLIPAVLFCSLFCLGRLGSAVLSCLSFGCTGQGVVPDLGEQDSPCPCPRRLMSPWGDSAVPSLGAEPPPCHCSQQRNIKVYLAEK